MEIDIDIYGGTEKRLIDIEKERERLEIDI